MGYKKLFSAIFNSENITKIKEHIDDALKFIREYQSISKEESNRIIKIVKSAFKEKMKVGDVIVFGKYENTKNSRQYLAFLINSSYRRDIQVMLAHIEIENIETKEENYYIVSIVDESTGEIKQQRLRY